MDPLLTLHEKEWSGIKQFTLLSTGVVVVVVQVCGDLTLLYIGKSLVLNDLRLVDEVQP